MKTTEEIKEALKTCADYRAWGDCNGCPYEKVTSCPEVLMIDALVYINQLETRIAELEAKPSKPAPAPVQYGLPKGWIDLHRSDGMLLLYNARAITQVMDYADGTAVYHFGESCGTAINETAEEIMQKIRRATT